jgi:hypothetical protein
VRADAFVPGDLFGREPTRDEPKDLDLAVGQREVSARII